LQQSLINYVVCTQLTILEANPSPILFLPIGKKIIAERNTTTSAFSLQAAKGWLFYQGFLHLLFSFGFTGLFCSQIKTLC
jgi:hypothetical protein